MKLNEYRFGIIGNGSFMSYIDDKASVVWQCWPKFDDSFIFGSLISEKKGGEFSITPKFPVNSTQRYIPNTNILETEFACEDGKFKVIDFAPRFELNDEPIQPNQLFRKIELIKGNPTIRIYCEPVGDYGNLKPTQISHEKFIQFKNLNADVKLYTDVDIQHIQTNREFQLTENRHLILTYNQDLSGDIISSFQDSFEKTKKYWQKWVKDLKLPLLYQNEIIRSALTLRLHQHEETGAIIAAGTTSLPESPGEQRNWDYRYCWIRDSYFTLNALTKLGSFGETQLYSNWLKKTISVSEERIQPMYKINSEAKIEESIIDLEGYKGNAPVRIGNQAYLQTQNDVYGQILLSLLPLYTEDLISNTDRTFEKLICKALESIEKYMDEADAGIWEFRGKQQSHAESFLFHWAGAKAAKEIAIVSHDKSLQEKAEKLIEKASENIEQCYDENVRAYGMSIENKKLNASEFLLINMNYLGSKDAKKASEHLSALESELKFGDDLIYRYRDHDDFGETNSTFLICAFWYAEALIDIGQIEKGKRIFDSLINRSNYLGLFSEDIDPKDGSQWGNIAQTYSHAGLINTALKIGKAYGTN